MITEVDWPYLYDSKAARKLGFSTAMIRKLVEKKIIRGEEFVRKNGSTFYVVNKEDIENFDLGKYLS